MDDRDVWEDLFACAGRGLLLALMLALLWVLARVSLWLLAGEG